MATARAWRDRSKWPMRKGKGSRSAPRHFFIIGCQRCGTTGLARWLDRHPDISIAQPLVPEPKFFLTDGSEGTDPAQYRTLLFGDRSEAALLGEKSTSYIEVPPALMRLEHVFPEARIVCLVRDPIARAVSHARFSHQNGLEPLAVEDALWRDLRGEDPPSCPAGLSASPFNYLSRGRYDRYLPHVLRTFDNRLLVVQTERLAFPVTVERLLSHLGVAPHPAPFVAVEGRSEAVAIGKELRRALCAYFRPMAENWPSKCHLDIDLSLWASFCN